MILELDAGNSCIKWRLLGDGRKLSGIVSHDPFDWQATLPTRAVVDRARVANVAGDEAAASLRDFIAKTWGVTAEFATSTSACVGVRNSYRNPEALGVDRWLAILAAWRHSARRPCVVVDAGSALTVDFVTASGVFPGGYIVPGLSMMIEALRGGTSQIDFAQGAGIDVKPGSNTVDAVQNGCLAMSVAFIEAVLRRFEAEEGEARVLVTGGGGELLVQHLSANVEYQPDLVLDGLALALP